MKVYRVFYRFNDVHTSLVMRHYTAFGAFSAAEVMLQAGAKAYGIEEVMP